MQVNEYFGPDYEAYAVGQVMQVKPAQPLKLECGAEWEQFPVAYQVYGEMNADKSNVILLCHGLTGDQYAASEHPVTGKPGWWEFMIGAGKPLDTNLFCIIATNVIGSCMGSYGPKSINSATGEAWGTAFPVVTVEDMVHAQAALLDALEVTTLASVIGGSMGGMQALAWSLIYPERVKSCVAIATAARHSAQNIAFHEIGRQAVMADPDWQGGHYLKEKTYPSKGLAVARMTAHVTYLSEQALAEKFGRHLQDKSAPGFGFDADFQVESYLRYQGANFVKRFDPNAYLYITRAMDYFDLTEGCSKNLAHKFKGSPVKFCVLSFSSDWCFPTTASRELVKALTIAGAEVSFAEIESDKGHDAFLIEDETMKKMVGGFLEGLQR